MANNLYDTGAPQRVIVVNQQQPETAVARSPLDMDRILREMVQALARNAARNRARRAPPEATRAASPCGPILDAEFEVVDETPPRRQLAAPKPTRRKK